MRVGDRPQALSIGEEAFKCCDSLTSVVFSGNAPYIGNCAFESVSDDCIVRVPRNSTGWGVEIPGKWKGMWIEYQDP